MGKIKGWTKKQDNDFRVTTKKGKRVVPSHLWEHDDNGNRLVVVRESRDSEWLLVLLVPVRAKSNELVFFQRYDVVLYEFHRTQQAAVAAAVRLMRRNP